MMIHRENIQIMRSEKLIRIYCPLCMKYYMIINEDSVPITDENGKIQCIECREYSNYGDWHLPSHIIKWRNKINENKNE